jgi:hypothetical protein
MLDTITCPDCQTMYKTAEHGDEIEGADKRGGAARQHHKLL